MELGQLLQSYNHKKKSLAKAITDSSFDTNHELKWQFLVQTTCTER